MKPDKEEFDPSRAGKISDELSTSALMTAEQVCAYLGGVSKRMVYRLSSSGRMPRKIKLGRLARWRRSDLDEWIAGGCKPIDKRWL
jgi:excisionase family DNA binding protein